jgi:hypothetical protein
MGCAIPHQSNAVNIPHQTNAGLSEVTWKWWDEYPVFDISPTKKITGRSVGGARGL